MEAATEALIHTQGNGTVLPCVWVPLSKIIFLRIRYPFEQTADWYFFLISRNTVFLPQLF